MRGIITLLTEPLDSVNREAKIDLLKSGGFHVRNANMPYMGTLNEIWTQEEFDRRLKDREIRIKWDD